MITVLLCVVFSSLTFKGLTLAGLMAWFNVHPFLFLMVLWELLHGIASMNINFRG